MRLFLKSQVLLSSRIVILLFALGALNLRAQHGNDGPPGGNDAELAIKKFQPAAGLKVELFAAEPQLENPVSFSIDEKGRFFIAETHRYREAIFDITRNLPWLVEDLSFRTVDNRAAFLARTFATNINFLTKDSELIRLVEDRDNDGRADASSIFATGFRETVSGTGAGVLARHGAVWYTCIPDLWRFDESAGGPPARQKLHTGYGVRISVSGHDLHGLVMGPDGRIYFTVGDRGANVKSREGKTLYTPETGAVFRCNPDGTGLEIFATGLRNPQELAFDQYGNLWTDDNDTAGKDDPRVLYLVEGGDYGWRGSYQYDDGFGPWVLENVWKGNIDDVLPLAGVVAQGPSGLAFNPGTGLSEKYHNRFLVCDFPGGVWSFGVKPKGAYFVVTEKEKFLWNLWPTDVAFGNDCNVYVSDWVEGWFPSSRGRLYRIVDANEKNNALAQQTKTLLAEGMGKRSESELKELLAHADMRVRLEAQFEAVNRKNYGLLSSVASANAHQLARLHAIWGLAQLARPGSSEGAKSSKAAAAKIVQSLTPLLNDADPEIRAQAVKALSECRQPITRSLLPRLLKDASPRVRFFAAMALNKIGNANAVPDIISMLRENADADAYLTHAGLMALLQLEGSRHFEGLVKDASPAVRRAALLGLRRLKDPRVARFLDDADARIATEAARAINDVPINEAMPQLAAALNHTSRWMALPDGENGSINHRAQFLSRAINANFRQGQPDNAAAIARFAQNSKTPEALRMAALDALSDWARPGPLDRVMGLWRPLADRSAEPARSAIADSINQFIQAPSAALATAAIRCAGRLDLKQTVPLLMEEFTNQQTTVPIRITLLSALDRMNDEHLTEAVKIALQDRDLSLRREGVRLLGKVHAADAARQIEKLIGSEKDLRLIQTAFETLGTLKDPHADDVLAEQLLKLLAGTQRAELRLDITEAAAKRSAPGVRELLHRYEQTGSKTDSLAAYRDALAGGDPANGRKIFFEKKETECSRCHKLGAQGGTVGPPLDGIGKRQTRDYLLESIVLPNAKIAAGFENLIITLRNGTSVAGMVKSENANQLVLNSPEDGEVKINPRDISKRTIGLSAMPEGMAQMLSKRELRDLVEYLSRVK